MLVQAKIICFNIFLVVENGKGGQKLRQENKPNLFSGHQEILFTGYGGTYKKVENLQEYN